MKKLAILFALLSIIFSACSVSKQITADNIQDDFVSTEEFKKFCKHYNFDYDSYELVWNDSLRADFPIDFYHFFKGNKIINEGYKIHYEFIRDFIHNAQIYKERFISIPKVQTQNADIIIHIVEYKFKGFNFIYFHADWNWEKRNLPRGVGYITFVKLYIPEGNKIVFEDSGTRNISLYYEEQ